MMRLGSQEVEKNFKFMDDNRRSAAEADVKEIRKKLRNRQSAQRARDRQKARMRWLEREVALLTMRNQALQHENVTLRNLFGDKVCDSLVRNMSQDSPTSDLYSNVYHPIQNHTHNKKTVPNESYYESNKESSTTARANGITTKERKRFQVENFAGSRKEGEVIENIAVISPTIRSSICQKNTVNVSTDLLSEGKEQSNREREDDKNENLYRINLPGQPITPGPYVGNLPAANYNPLILPNRMSHQLQQNFALTQLLPRYLVRNEAESPRVEPNQKVRVLQGNYFSSTKHGPDTMMPFAIAPSTLGFLSTMPLLFQPQVIRHDKRFKGQSIDSECGSQTSSEMEMETT